MRRLAPLLLMLSVAVVLSQSSSPARAARSSVSGGKVKIVIAGTNDTVPPVTDGSLQGKGTFRASGAITDTGTALGYRTANADETRITLRFVTSDCKGHHHVRGRHRHEHRPEPRRDALDGAGSPRLVLVREPDQLGVECAHPQLAFGVRLVELAEPDGHVAADDDRAAARLDDDHLHAG